MVAGHEPWGATAIALLATVPYASPTTPKVGCLVSPTKYQHNNLEVYCNNILVNLPRPSNVSTQAIISLIWNGGHFWERPVWRMEMVLLEDDWVINGDCKELEERCNSSWLSLVFLFESLVFPDKGLVVLPPALNVRGESTLAVLLGIVVYVMLMSGYLDKILWYDVCIEIGWSRLKRIHQILLTTVTMP